jgi:dTDP-4-dehydrorhamnose 3,5-epimerase
MFRVELFHQSGVVARFVQENLAISRPGALRGLHYQLPPKAQAKLVSVLKGKIFDVVVDVRRSSPTFLNYVGVELSAEGDRGLFVPEGFAHGFCVTSPEDAYVSYKLGALYDPPSERGIVWNDPALCIEWPQRQGPWVMSERDQNLPPAAMAELFD